jgi:hypothetical protein
MSGDKLYDGHFGSSNDDDAVANMAMVDGVCDKLECPYDFVRFYRRGKDD